MSGDRLWSLLKELSGSPDVLFKYVFLHNYCPLFFLKESAKNVTPPELKVGSPSSVSSLLTQHSLLISHFSTLSAFSLSSAPLISLLSGPSSPYFSLSSPHLYLSSPFSLAPPHISLLHSPVSLSPSTLPHISFPYSLCSSSPLLLPLS